MPWEEESWEQWNYEKKRWEYHRTTGKREEWEQTGWEQPWSSWDDDPYKGILWWWEGSDVSNETWNPSDESSSEESENGES